MSLSKCLCAPSCFVPYLSQTGWCHAGYCCSFLKQPPAWRCRCVRSAASPNTMSRWTHRTSRGRVLPSPQQRSRRLRRSPPRRGWRGWCHSPHGLPGQWVGTGLEGAQRGSIHKHGTAVMISNIILGPISIPDLSVECTYFC